MIYGLFQIFSGRFGHDEATGQPVFLDGEEYVYGESHPDAGSPVPQEARQQYLDDNSGFLEPIMDQLKPMTVLTADNPWCECPEGVYMWARAQQQSPDGGNTDGNTPGGEGGSGSVDIIWTDIEDAVPTNPTISGNRVDGVYTLTVENPAAGHRYKVYQIYTGSVSGDGRNLGDVKYGSNYGVTGNPVPASELEGIDDAREFAKNITTGDNGIYGDPVTVLTPDSPKAELPAGYYLVMDESDDGIENDALSDFVVAVVGTTKFTPKATSVPKFDKIIADAGQSVPPNVLVIPEGTTEIADHEYEGMTGKDTVYIPASVTKIGDYAFAGGSDVRYFYFEEGSCLESIGRFAFYGCRSLENFIIPANEGIDCVSVGEGAWFDCTELESLYVPSDYKTFMDTVSYSITSFIGSISVDFTAPDGTVSRPVIYFRDSFDGFVMTPTTNHTTPWWEACMNRQGISLDDYKAETGWKEYTPGTGTSSTDTTVNYGTGDVVPFELSAVIPQSVKSYGAYRIVFHDTMSAGLAYDEGSMKVYAGDTEIDPSAYTVNFDGQQFSVEIPDVKAEPFNAVPGSRIYVKYSATLTDGAVFRNTNDAYLEYSNDPKSDGTGRTVGDEVTAFTFTVSFDKVDGKSGDALEGAGFTMYRKDADGSYVRFGEEITGGSSFSFSGLGTGDYRLVESTTPSGYNTMEDLDFSIVADSTEDADGTARVTGLKIVTQGGTLDDAVLDGWTTSTDDGTIGADIANYKGSELPSTGGTGTVMFYVAGGCIAFAVCIVLVARKRNIT